MRAATKNQNKMPMPTIFPTRILSHIENQEDEDDFNEATVFQLSLSTIIINYIIKETATDPHLKQLQNVL